MTPPRRTPKTITVELAGFTGKRASLNANATEGATVGTDLFAPDGSLVTWAQILNPSTPSTGSGPTTTDDLPEGAYHLYFTTQRAQDAVGGILTNTANVTLAYDGVAHTIKADLTNVTVIAGGALKKYGFDSKGRLSQSSAATTNDLTEGTTNLYFTNPRVAASLVQGAGIVLSTDVSGNTTIANASSVLPLLTDQSGVNLTDQSGVQLTGNSINNIPILAPFTLATLPSAATYLYGLIMVTDLTGGLQPCYSDGTNWRRCSDQTIAS